MRDFVSVLEIIYDINKLNHLIDVSQVTYFLKFEEKFMMSMKKLPVKPSNMILKNCLDTLIVCHSFLPPLKPGHI